MAPSPAQYAQFQCLHVVFLTLSLIQCQFQGFFQQTISASDFAHEVNRLTLYFVYLAIGQFGTIYIATVGFTSVGEHITAELRARYLSSILRQNIAYFDCLGAGEIVSRAFFICWWDFY